MSDRLLGVFGHERLQFDLGILVFEESRACTAEDTGKFRPSVRGAHVDDAHSRNPHAWRFRQEQARGLTRFNAAPELFLSREQEMLVERISRDDKLNPPAAPGDD